MTLSKEKLGALCFFILAIAYGFEAQQIRLLPGDQFEAFTARTMPYALAWLTGLVSFLVLVLPQKGSGETFTRVFQGLNWPPTILMMVLMVLYGLALTPLGFLLSTVLFLIAGIYTLGERRWKIILLTAVPSAVGFWFILVKLLNVYLAPGEIFLALNLGA
ncbi:tripartite tricarboxylate transporter TctB family protein [Kiloniella laminariae]|uniref:tripartite tricarboxylate transporter TctB family protein n=1 Tax=Kiloniella laminariae TaxID=454162 RepID=UPI000362A4A4|nr:tripartite tricarboxylate transporter TctB family protein [Kiloniella laminariae]